MTPTLLLAALLAAAAPTAHAAGPSELDAPTPFEATATMSPDGRWTLVLLPGAGWAAAELSVRGGGTFDLGPEDGSHPVEISGLLDAAGTLYVDLALVTPAARGQSWSFSVVPELLPTAPPTATRDGARRHGVWPFRRGGP